MKDTTNNNYRLVEIIECPQCTMLLPSTTIICTDCGKSVIYEVPENFQNYDFHKMYCFVITHLRRFEEFIQQKENTLLEFDFNGAYTKLIKETIQDPTDEKKQKLSTITEYCNRMDRVLYLGEINLTELENNNFFLETKRHINKIANRDNCLRPILYPNDEDLDLADYYDTIEEYNSFKSIDNIKDEVQQIEPTLTLDEFNRKIKIKEDLIELNFFTLPKVSVLRQEQQNKLFELIFSNKVEYTIAWLHYLDFLKTLESNYSKNANQRHVLIAKILKSTEREIKGQINVLKPASKENRERYKSHRFSKEIEENYNKLKIE